MSTNFYAKIKKEDLPILETEFIKYLTRFINTYDFRDGFSNIEVTNYYLGNKINPFCEVIINSILKHLPSNKSLEKYLNSRDLNKKFEFLSKKNPSDIKEKDLDFLRGKLFKSSAKLHIGKRSSSGLFCENCDITMNKLGHSLIHYSGAEQDEVCPYCGSPRGEIVHLSCSFTWQYDKKFWLNIFNKVKNVEYTDEYGEKYALKDLKKEIIKNCQIQYDSVYMYFC